MNVGVIMQQHGRQSENNVYTMLNIFQYVWRIKIFLIIDKGIISTLCRGFQWITWMIKWKIFCLDLCSHKKNAQLFGVEPIHIYLFVFLAWYIGRNIIKTK